MKSDGINNIFFSDSNKETQILAGKTATINLFFKAAKTVPAYKDFLKKNKIIPEKIFNFKDFEQIPFTDKKNYIDKYDIKDLVWDGDLSKNSLINSSSGTTGKPYYWPLDTHQIDEGEVIHEMIFKNNF
ncbi:MAG: hypothetical protein AAB966_05725, partial [Patescibacteria group bacterium]